MDESQKKAAKNPAVLLSTGMLAWVLLSFLFINSSGSLGLNIPTVTWLVSIGGIVCMVLGLLSLLWMKDV